MLNRPFDRLRIPLVTLIVALSLGLTQCQPQAANPPSDKTSQNAPVPHEEALQSALNLSTAIAQVARKTIPAVVHIEVTEHREVSNPLLPFGNDPLFRHFFNIPSMPRKFKQELRGLGTGMIIDPQGHILTNNHVVAGANEIQVLLADGNQYKAKIVGTDPKTDLAVVQIAADENLPVVTFGNSDSMAVGDWVVAIGHPRGLDQTVTQGIISAKHRRGILDPSSYQDYLQTDAAINPGNSGGPLLNLEGQVVGVNAAIASTSGGFEGIGFAIPSNMARHIARALIDHGKVERGWLGVSIQDVTPTQVKSLELVNRKGAWVADVAAGSPAQKAGLKKNDVITAYQGQAIPDAAALQNKVAETAAGDIVALTLVRDGQSIDLTATIGSLDEALRVLAASLESRLGVVVRPLTIEETQNYQLESGQGVAIRTLDADGVLAKAGFEKDDVILAINNIPVKGVEGFVALAKALPAHQPALLTALDHRSGQSGNVQIDVG
jgi:serine protease Do